MANGFNDFQFFFHVRLFLYLLIKSLAISIHAFGIWHFNIFQSASTPPLTLILNFELDIVCFFFCLFSFILFIILFGVNNITKWGQNLNLEWYEMRKKHLKDCAVNKEFFSILIEIQKSASSFFSHSTYNQFKCIHDCSRISKEIMRYACTVIPFPPFVTICYRLFHLISSSLSSSLIMNANCFTLKENKKKKSNFSLCDRLFSSKFQIPKIK